MNRRDPETIPLLKHLRKVTPAQARVLRLALMGRTNRAIAEALGLSEVTVKRHFSVCLRKYGVGSRAELFAMVQKQLVAMDVDAKMGSMVTPLQEKIEALEKEIAVLYKVFEKLGRGIPK